MFCFILPIGCLVAANQKGSVYDWEKWIPHVEINQDQQQKYQSFITNSYNTNK